MSDLAGRVRNFKIFIFFRYTFYFYEFQPKFKFISKKDINFKISLLGQSFFITVPVSAWNNVYYHIDIYL